ncbi:RNA polymerase sigma factor [Roseivirga misakiensis]|uniref:RNA polymerase subunit sigma n=1 Tax=Roseivirga misakiensis TaxID=1563681 RepID=A0A1E5SKC2_9BACT|nr:RNA polymerase sigma factor [Roseivirga misakiensis]OEJ99553.1 RNA polymerase subunit sigma [Roseivirga misakiensis]
MNPFVTTYSTDQDDQSLIKQAVKGNKAALEALLKKHQPYIYNIAWKMVQMPDDAKDITQEVMVKVITNLSKFRGESEFRTWLYRIVTNHFLKMKKQKREKLVNESFDAFSDRLSSIPDTEMSTLEQEEKAIEVREMNMACMSGMLLCLTREQRLVYILGAMFNADHTIGAEILDISKGNFRVRLSRAKKDLHSFMNDKCGLVNKSNPCRCHKKVTAVIENQVLDSKNLLFNREEYASFQQYIGNSPQDFSDLIEEKVLELHSQLPYNNTFNKKGFLNDFINDQRVISLLNLN